ncbi:MAG: FAD-dependent oxidoreductase [Burkholderiaceae bacterium]|nr:FAD-dependent oxidoreductase [Burkholderiaceae bacterium]
MTRTIVEPERHVPVLAEPDVLVVGGGAAGIAAACAAARGGARTMLIEAWGCLGGTLTLVTLGGFCGTHMIVDDERLARVVGGLYLELEDRLAARDAVLPPQRHGRILGVPYESASLKLVADEMVAAYGVRVMLHTSAVATVTDGARLTAVIVENKGGRAAIAPRIVIDASGDADVAASAGADFALGDAGTTQYASTMFRMCGVDTAVARALTRPQIRELLERAVADGYALPRTTTGVHMNPLEGVVHLNVTKLANPKGEPFLLVDPEQLSEAERVGRQQVKLYEEVFRRYVPGFARARVMDIGSRVGVRETRLVRGDSVLTEGHVRNCTKSGDRIACSSWPLELHGQGRDTTWEFLPEGEWYGVPWGCLVVAGLDNLLVAGRNLSAEHTAHASVRVAGPCIAMGEAAGTAAAMSLSAGGAVRSVAVAALQQNLRSEGAILDPGG